MLIINEGHPKKQAIIAICEECHKITMFSQKDFVIGNGKYSIPDPSIRTCDCITGSVNAFSITQQSINKREGHLGTLSSEDFHKIETGFRGL